MDPEKDHLKGYRKIDTLDFSKDKRKLALSYLLRVIGVAVFGGIFIIISRLIHPHLALQANTFIGLELPNLPLWASIVLLILDIVFVLALHELVHASVFYIDQKIPPKIGIRGLVIFAAAPGYLSRRPVMTVNAIAPFSVISLLGILLIFLLPHSLLPWIFIPSVVNAAAAGGDFMILHWMYLQPKEAVYEDDGDAMTAYISE